MKTWKIGDKGANEVIQANVAFYDKVRAVLSRRCKVPDCGYVISSLEESFSVPEYTLVCGVCYHMHEALQHPGLKNVFYFRNLHQDWKKDRDDPRRKDRLGL